MTSKLVLFDGICNLCNGWVDLIIKLDPGEKLKVAALQSPVGKKYLDDLHISSENLKTIIFIQNDKVYFKSTAILRILMSLKWPWPLAGVLLIIPQILRNLVYNLIAKYRYTIFGKRDICRVPTEKEKSRFLE